MRKLIIVALSATALLWPRPAIAPISAQQPPADRVRIEHELLRVVPLIGSRPPRPARASRPAAVKVAGAQGEDIRSQPRGLVGRARRVLFGDGRYRPEPFPKPGR